jgi:predicted flap endonuclease-1-like 5' DNA nuclease
MTEHTNQSSCPKMCWLIAAVLGLFILVLSLALWDLGWIASTFFGGLVFIVSGLLLSWLFCTGDSAPMGASSDAKAGETSAADHTAPASVAAPAAAAASVAAAAAPEPAVEIKPSKPLAGEADLDARKGSWTYTADASDTAKPAAAAHAPARNDDYDGDGVVEGENEGTRPATLSAPRDGGADDLKRIKGIGPKLEKLCNDMGFYHFDQIAAWTADEVAWVNANLQGFKGRVSRDEWVAQAKPLASCAETEFSKRVDKGGVY